MGVLDGKIAVITGGTSGIGAGTAGLFISAGARVVVASPFPEEGEPLVQKLGPMASFRRTDVAREDEVKALVEDTVSRFGRLDCMFNNAGIAGPGGSITELDMNRYDAAMGVLLRGVVLGMKHAGAAMLRQGWGSIFNTGSIAGRITGYSPQIYAAAKAAVVHLTRCVAMELGEKGIRVNSISPGGIVTPIFGKSLGLSPEQVSRTTGIVEARLSKGQPIPRAGMPEDIAQAALFLASDASSFVNGHDLVVDGGAGLGRGWSAQMAANADIAQALKAGAKAP